jgi:uncharacterized membrane protein YphA (DoxX/SURF4 family)
MKRAIVTLAWLARVTLGLVLIYSGMIKIARPYEFLNSVFQYQLLGPNSATLVAAVLPFVELTLGAALLCGAFTLGAALLASILFVIFTVGQASALLRGLDADCGCFGAVEKVGWASLLRTGALLAGALFCVAPGYRAATARRTHREDDAARSVPAPTGADHPDRRIQRVQSVP